MNEQLNELIRILNSNDEKKIEPILHRVNASFGNNSTSSEAKSSGHISNINESAVPPSILAGLVLFLSSCEAPQIKIAIETCKLVCRLIETQYGLAHAVNIYNTWYA